MLVGSPLAVAVVDVVPDVVDGDGCTMMVDGIHWEVSESVPVGMMVSGALDVLVGRRAEDVIVLLDAEVTGTIGTMVLWLEDVSDTKLEVVAAAEAEAASVVELASDDVVGMLAADDRIEEGSDKVGKVVGEAPVAVKTPDDAEIPLPELTLKLAGFDADAVNSGAEDVMAAALERSAVDVAVPFPALETSPVDVATALALPSVGVAVPMRMLDEALERSTLVVVLLSVVEAASVLPPETAATVDVGVGEVLSVEAAALLNRLPKNDEMGLPLVIVSLVELVVLAAALDSAASLDMGEPGVVVVAAPGWSDVGSEVAEVGTVEVPAAVPLNAPENVSPDVAAADGAASEVELKLRIEERSEPMTSVVVGAAEAEAVLDVVMAESVPAVDDAGHETVAPLMVALISKGALVLEEAADPRFVVAAAAPELVGTALCVHETGWPSMVAEMTLSLATLDDEVVLGSKSGESREPKIPGVAVVVAAALGADVLSDAEETVGAMTLDGTPPVEANELVRAATEATWESLALVDGVSVEVALVGAAEEAAEPGLDMLEAGVEATAEEAAVGRTTLEAAASVDEADGVGSITLETSERRAGTSPKVVEAAADVVGSADVEIAVTVVGAAAEVAAAELVCAFEVEGLGEPVDDAGFSVLDDTTEMDEDDTLLLAAALLDEEEEEAAAAAADVPAVGERSF